MTESTESLSFTGRLSLQDTLDIHRYHSRIVVRRSVWWLLATISLLIAALVIFAGWRTHFEIRNFVVLALCAYFPFGWALLDRWLIKRRYRQQAGQAADATVTFTADAVSTSHPAADIRLRWDQIACVVDTPRGLLFLLPPHAVWFWLPRRVFYGTMEREAVLALVTEHRIPIRRMT